MVLGTFNRPSSQDNLTAVIVRFRPYDVAALQDANGEMGQALASLSGGLEVCSALATCCRCACRNTECFGSLDYRVGSYPKDPHMPIDSHEANQFEKAWTIDAIEHGWPRRAAMMVMEYARNEAKRAMKSAKRMGATKGMGTKNDINVKVE
jgi:hypothetical protein